MADTTFGVKVPEELKEQLTKLMQNSGLPGKDFMQSLVNVYQVEKTKEGVPEVAQDLKELQSLTQRINNIYLNLGYRIDNLMKSKETEMQDQLKRKDDIIVDLQNKVEELNSKNEMLTEAFNTSVNEKDELYKRVNELTESNNNIKELNEQYKSKIDTMAGIVEEYKKYKEDVEVYKKIILEKQATIDKMSRDSDSKMNIIMTLNKEKDDLEKKISNLEREIENLKEAHKKEIEKLEESHKNKIKSIEENNKEKSEFEKQKEILKLQQIHQEEIQKINDLHNKKIEDYQNKYKDLLNELEKVKTNDHTNKNTEKGNIKGAK